MTSEGDGGNAQQTCGLQGVEPHPRHHHQGAAPGVRLPGTQAQLGAESHEQQGEEGAVAGQQGPLAPRQQRAIGATDQGQGVEQGPQQQGQPRQAGLLAEPQDQHRHHQGGQEPEVDHAAHPPDVERIPQLHLPLARHGGQVALAHRRERVERYQHVEQAPRQPEPQQGSAVAQCDRQRVARGEGGLQEVTGAQEEQRHREAAELVDDGPDQRVGRAVPQGGVEGVAERGEMDGHHGQDGHHSPAFDAGDAHDSSRRSGAGRTLSAAGVPYPAAWSPTVTPIGGRLPFVTRGAGKVTAAGSRIPFWCR